MYPRKIKPNMFVRCNDSQSETIIKSQKKLMFVVRDGISRRTMWIVPRVGSAVKWGDTGAFPDAQPGAAGKGGGEPTGVDGLLL